jgi:transcriptional regulator with XRE-family HTH domain
MLGTRLKAVRNRRGMSQGQVARYAKVAQSTLSELERGEIAPKTIDALVNLAGYFGCSVDYLLGTSNDFSPAANRNASEAALNAINLIDSLPPEKRPAVVAVLRAIIELMEVGVPLPDPIEDADFARFEPVEARDGGGVNIESEVEEAVQQKVRARKDYDLALLKKMVPPEVYEEVKALVNAGHLLTEAEKVRFLDAARRNSLQQRFELLGDGDTLSRG